MHRKLAFLALASAVLTACSDPITSSGSARLAPIAEISGNVQTELVANEYIVALRSTQVSANQLSATALSMAATAGAQITYVYGHAINGFAVRADAKALAALRANASVEYVEPVQVMRAIATQNPSPSWGLDRIDQVNLPLSNSFTYPTGGGPVHVYIIDTGLLTTHNDFAGRVSSTSSNHINPTGGNPAWTDCNGHGTHVAGTIAGSTYGIAKNATVHAARVLDCNGSGTSASVVAGINWVIANAVQPAVSNMSLGGGVDVAIDNATNAMHNAGIVSAVAAGNSNSNACNFSPARAANAVTVGATTSTDARSSFSNVGSCLDIFAPGSLITSDWIGSNSATNTISGTSMASPHVAGVAALYRSQNPGATAAQTVAAIISNATLNKVTNAGPSSPNRLLYMGFLNGAPPPPNINPVANFTVNCVQSPEGPLGFDCTLNGSSSTDADGNVVAWNWTFTGRPPKSGVQVVYTVLAGTYTATLTVTDNAGGTNTKSQQFTVGGPPPPPTNLPPVANFTFNCVVRPDGIGADCIFDGSSSTDSDGNIVSYAWTATGRPARTGVTVSYPYPRGSHPTITLTVTDDDGATNTKSVQITVP